MTLIRAILDALTSPRARRTPQHGNPIDGCTDAVAATRRAAALVPYSPNDSGDRRYWEGSARRVLAAYLHAAALGTRSSYELAAWFTCPDVAAHEVPALLRRSDQPAWRDAFLDEVRRFHSTNGRTRAAITSTVLPVVWEYAHAALAQDGGGR